jgi:cytochrome b6-f complex iron-sulfur subunit
VTRRPAPPAARAGRRAFLGRVWTGLGAVAGAELVCVAGATVAARQDGDEPAPEGLVEAGPVEAFARGTVRAFPAWRLYLVRLADGGFLALSSRCTHLGCAVGWDEERGVFPCPCHGSTFDLRGEVTGPPALRALDHYPVLLEEGVVKVDLSRPLRRGALDAGQVAHP